LRAAQKAHLDLSTLQESWKMSDMLQTISDPVTSAGSPIEGGTRVGTAPTAPDS